LTVDLLYVAHNRLAFVEATFATLRENTDWSQVSRLHVVDDHSTDGTLQYLDAAVRGFPCPTTFTSGRFGGPVAAMNHVLDRSDADVLAKIDNDLIVCSTWLEHMLATLNANPEVDALGMEPGFAEPVASLDSARTAKPARWIGGQGLIRTRVFAKQRPLASERWFGWTSFQRRWVKAAWISPDLPCFNLDHLPFEPWLSLTAGYVRKGWQRPWSPYPTEMNAAWEWWAKQQAAVA
jgi:glycosyltransferase involved in cell wall biosynthesis